MRKDILAEIDCERDRQIDKWGETADDGRSPKFWYEVISDYNGWARRMGEMNSPVKQRTRLIQIAAIAVAAVEELEKGSAKENGHD